MKYKNLFRKKSISDILNSLTESERNPESEELFHSLEKNLTVKDLTAFGIAAIIGAGIFSTIGNAAYNGGPAVALLFIFTAIACGFSGLCYAEFASRIPVAGSAYTYAYASFGELFAWIIGWDLILEYAIGNIAVAISWSDYFTSFLNSMGIHIPDYFTMDYLSAYRGYNEANNLILSGKKLEQLPDNLINAYNAWINSPNILGFHLIADIPALLIVIFITYLVFRGIKESKNASNIMVAIKLGIILMVILIGAFYVKPENWIPFAPNGFSGVMSGVAAVFFAYIGFDAISTTAEECKNPQKDLPKGIIYSLIICTILYIAISFVLTGLVSYKELNVGDPLAYVFGKIGLNWVSGVISFSAIIAMTGVLLVFQIGQPRIWMSMSRDGLLPKIFSKIHHKYKTPYIATIITGLLVGIPALFMNLTEVTDLTSIGTLFAFVLVCSGVLLLEKDNENKASFKVPYINGKFIVPIIFIISIIGINNYSENGIFSILDISNKDNIPYLIFFISFFIISLLSFLKNLSLIPVLGILSCFYLMSELGYTNWIRFIIWLLIGLLIYFLYGYKNSNESKKLS
ncbi:MAG: amino acid permease [Candidatus Sericytochromatia bacterium]|nr:MAG: amino acid permease [Candidatus Sericytochromatia bacterium]